MTFNIICNSYSFSDDFKESLLYLFPEQIDNINKVTRTLTAKIINIIDGEILCDKIRKYNDIDIFDIDLIRIVTILKNIDNNAFLIKIDNEEEYENICDIDYKFDINTSSIENFYYIVSKHIFDITEDEYKLFFKKYKLIDFDTYIRSIKLKQLL